MAKGGLPPSIREIQKVRVNTFRATSLDTSESSIMYQLIRRANNVTGRAGVSWYEWRRSNQLLSAQAPSDWLMPARLGAKYSDCHFWLEECQESLLANHN